MLLVPHPVLPAVDPRDALDKARRMELFKFAQANGITEITHDWAAKDMRALLRQRGLTHIHIPPRVFGRPDEKPVLMNAKGKSMPVEAQTPQERIQQPERQMKPVSGKQEAWKGMPIKDMGINDLRWACKAQGIPLARTTNMAAMKQLLADKGLK